MITPMQMYWLTRLDGIRNTSEFLIFLSAAAIIAAIFCAVAWLDDKEERFRRLSVLSMWLSVVALSAGVLIRTFLPSTKEMAAILIVPKIAASEKVQDAGNRLYDLAVEWMDALKPAKKEDAE